MGCSGHLPSCTDLQGYWLDFKISVGTYMYVCKNSCRRRTSPFEGGRKDAASYLRAVFWQLILPLISCLLFVEMSQSDWTYLKTQTPKESSLKIGNINKLGSSHLPPAIDSAFLLPREVLGSIHKVIASLVTSCIRLTYTRYRSERVHIFFFCFPLKVRLCGRYL